MPVNRAALLRFWNKAGSLYSDRSEDVLTWDIRRGIAAELGIDEPYELAPAPPVWGVELGEAIEIIREAPRYRRRARARAKARQQRIELDRAEQLTRVDAVAEALRAIERQRRDAERAREEAVRAREYAEHLRLHPQPLSEAMAKAAEWVRRRTGV